MADTAALVVTLSASLTQFQRDLDNATTLVDKSARDIEHRFEQINPDASGIVKNFTDNFSRSFAQAATGVPWGKILGGAGLVAAAGALVVELNSIVSGLAKIGDQAEELRLPVNLLQQLSVAADEARLP